MCLEATGNPFFTSVLLPMRVLPRSRFLGYAFIQSHSVSPASSRVAAQPLLSGSCRRARAWARPPRPAASEPGLGAPSRRGVQLSRSRKLSASPAPVTGRASGPEPRVQTPGRQGEREPAKEPPPPPSPRGPAQGPLPEGSSQSLARLAGPAPERMDSRPPYTAPHARPPGLRPPLTFDDAVGPRRGRRGRGRSGPGRLRGGHTGPGARLGAGPDGVGGGGGGYQSQAAAPPGNMADPLSLQRG